MKKIIILLSVIIFINNNAFTQGNLQFNKVINLNYNNSTLKTGLYIYDTLKVPTNKVWKVESAGLYGNIANVDGSKLVLNNFILFAIEDWTTSSTTIVSNYSVSSFPIWLSSGNHILKLHCGNSSGSNCTNVPASLSIIEFNIIP